MFEVGKDGIVMVDGSQLPTIFVFSAGGSKIISFQLLSTNETFSAFGEVNIELLRENIFKHREIEFSRKKSISEKLIISVLSAGSFFTARAEWLARG